MTERDGEGMEDRDVVRSLVKGLEVIQAFSRSRPRMTLTDVARETGMTRAAARRFLLTLVREGYADTDGKVFWLRPRVLDLGFAYLSAMGLWEVAQPVMREIVDRTGESCSASVLDGLDVVYIARVPTQRVLSVGLSVGSRLPAFATSMGRVLLAGMPADAFEALLARATLPRHTEHTVCDRDALRGIVGRVRADGHAMVDQELEIGLRSIAVPIRNRAGEVIAALNIGTHAGRVTPERMIETLLPPLVDGSGRITAMLPG